MGGQEFKQGWFFCSMYYWFWPLSDIQLEAPLVLIVHDSFIHILGVLAQIARSLDLARALFPSKLGASPFVYSIGKTDFLHDSLGFQKAKGDSSLLKSKAWTYHSYTFTILHWSTQSYEHPHSRRKKKKRIHLWIGEMSNSFWLCLVVWWYLHILHCRMTLPASFYLFWAVHLSITEPQEWFLIDSMAIGSLLRGTLCDKVLP